MSFARVRALVVVGVLVVFALVFVVVAIVRDSQGNVVTAENCPEGYKVANVALPREEKDVKINVFNATNQPGLATKVGNEFHDRTFQVLKTGNDPLHKRVDDVAVLRYGPKAIGAAQLLRAYFLDDAGREFDLNRTDDVVDVVIGNGFQQLATQTETRQSLAELGRPVLPDKTCAAAEKDS